MSRPIGYASHVERLEDRTLLASNILASLESSVNQPNDSTELILNIGPGGSPTLGFEVRASSGSTFDPAAVQIFDANTNAVIPLQLAEHDHGGSTDSLTLATLSPGEYSILVSGQSGSTGGFTIDVFVPGDSDGSGSVSDTEYQQALAATYQNLFGFNHYTSQLIQSLGLDPTTNYYSEEQDSDKDGDIDNHDLQMMDSNRNIPPLQMELIGDQDAPAVVAGLQVDSGVSTSDGISNELTILGNVSDESLITQFKVALDDGPFVDIFGLLSGGASGGSFTLTRNWLETNLNSGASLEGGPHTLHFMTADEHDNVSSPGQFDVFFQLDTTDPTTAAAISNQTLDEDFGTFNLGPFSNFFNQNGGTPLSYSVDSITSAIVDFDFSTDELILTSKQDMYGSADIVIQAIDVAGNAVLSNTFTVTIDPVNDAPVANNDSFNANEDNPATFIPGVILNDTDVENDTLTVTELNGDSGDIGIEVTLSSGALLTLNEDGEFSYNPNGQFEYLAAGQTATDSFIYTVDDGNGETDTATVTITIHGVNDAPTVSAGVEAARNEDDVNFSVDLLTNASDVDNGAILNVENVVSTDGDAGGVTVNGNSLDVDLSYYQKLDLTDEEIITFTYNVIDGLGGSVAQTATITITGENDDPTVSAGVEAERSEDDADFSVDLLTNASDVDVDANLVAQNVVLTEGDGGGVSINGSSLDVDLSYYQDLDAGDMAVITYSYDVVDGLGGSVAQTATITIIGQNDAPTVSAGVEAARNEDDANFSVDLLTNASDVDDSASLGVANVSLTGGDGGGVSLNGTSLDVDLSYYQKLDDGDTEVITYTYNVIDGLGGSVMQTATITITGENDGPTVSAGVEAEQSEDDDNFSVNLLTNASDVDEDASLNIESVVNTGGDDGGVTLNGTSLDVDLSYYQKLDLTDEEVITYTYNVIDNLGGSVAQTVTITITGENDAPTVSAGVEAARNEDDADFSVDLLTNASDVDEDANLGVDNLTNTDGDGGGVTLNGTSLDVNLSYYQKLDAGDTETITFTYDVIDNLGGSVEQTVTITITGENDDPTISAAVEAEHTEDDDNFSVNLLTNTSDVDEDANLGVDSLLNTGGDDGGVTLNGTSLDVDLSYYQKLDLNDEEVITYTYNVIDNLGGSVAQTVTITITGENDAPTVSAGVEAARNEDDADFSVDLLTNASDVDEDANLGVDNLTNTDGDGGGVTLNGTSLDVNLSYYQKLDAGDTETITFTYDVIDNLGGSVEQTVTITITGENDDPTVSDGVEAARNEDETNFSVNLLTNASDVDEDASLGVDNLTNTDGDDGGVTLNGTSLDVDMSYYQKLDAGDTETITFTYDVIDNLGGSVAQTVTITITGENDAPTVSVGVEAEHTEDDDNFSVDLLTNASDVDEDANLNVENVVNTGGDPGGVTVNGNALEVDLSYYQDLDFNDEEIITFTYDVFDGLGGSVEQTVTITITGENDAPTISAGVEAEHSEDDADFSVDLLTNASDVDADASLSVASLSNTDGDAGGITQNGNSLDVDLSYYQKLSATDTEVITYTYNVIDNLGGSVVQTVTITINGENDAPLAQDDSFDVNKELVFNGNVFANNDNGIDSDPDNLDTFTVSQVNGNNANVGTEIVLKDELDNNRGLLQLDETGSFSYNPNGDFTDVTGTDTKVITFEYQIVDALGATSTATVTITVSANQLPVANADGGFLTDEDHSLLITGLEDNDIDPDGDDDLLEVVGVDGVSTHGATLTLVDGSITYNPGAAFHDLAQGEQRVDTFQYTVQDERGGVSSGTVTVTVTGVNDDPSVSGGVEVARNEDDADFSVDLLTNASDVDNGASLSVENVSLSGGDAGGITQNGNSLNVDMSYYQKLDDGDIETITFTYDVIDGLGGSVEQTVTITITGENDDPTISAGVEAARNEDETNFSVNLLTNASDVDEAANLGVASLTNTGGDDGGVTLSGTSLDVDMSYYQKLDAGDTETITFTYDVIDNLGGSVAQTVTITITGENDAPTVSAGVEAARNEDETNFSVDLLTNASDVDEAASLGVDNLTNTDGDDGGVTLNGTSLDVDMSYYQKLDAGDTEIITFTYDVIDNLGGSVEQTVTITITGENDDPTISVAVEAEHTEDDGNFSVNLLTNASDVDEDANLGVDSLLNTGGDDGGVTLSGTSLDVDLSYYQKLDDGDTETITFTYDVIDNLGGSVEQTVTITITGENDDPTISAGVEAARNEDETNFSVDLLTNASDVDEAASLGVDNLTNTDGDDGGVTLNGTSLDVDMSYYQKLDAGDTEIITFTYDVIDNLGGSVEQTVTITITGENDDPTISVAVEAEHTEDDGNFSVDLLTNASDVDEDANLGVDSLLNTGGDDGGVTLNGTSLDVDMSYYQKLDAGDTETITFTYDVIDNLGGSVEQTVTITITGENDAPIVSAAVEAEHTEDDGNFSVDLLTNASDVDEGANLGVASLTNTGGDDGGVTLNGTSLDVDLSYYQKLDAGDTETITYTYNVSDGIAGPVAQTVTIIITGENDDPTVSDGVEAARNEDEADFSVDLLTNASDVDEDFSLGVDNLTNTDGDDGGVTLNGTSLDVDMSYYQKLDAGDTETITFTYDVIDNLGGSVEQTVTITITGENDAPIVSAAVEAEHTEDDGNFSVDLLTNASDVDEGANLGVASLTNTGGDDGGVTLNGTSLDVDLSYYQKLDAGDTETITYTYNVSDGIAGPVAQTVTIIITGENDDPTVSDGVEAARNEDETNFSVDLLTNASDVDEAASLGVDNLTNTDGDDGGVTLNGTSLDVDMSYYQKLDAGDTETITFTYDVIDNLGGSVEQTVTITIIGENDAPTVSDGVEAARNEDETNFSVDLLTSASDVDEDANLSVVSLSNTGGDAGGVTLNGTSLDVDLSYYQKLSENDTEVITFNYTVIDGEGGSVAQTVTITITGENEPLEATDLPNMTADGLTTITIDLDTYFNDPDENDVITYSVLSSETFDANFWVNTVQIIDGDTLEITFKDYASSQERLPTDITVNAASSGGVDDNISKTFQLSPDPQETVEVRLISRASVSSDRDFVYFRVEGAFGPNPGSALMKLTGESLDDLNFTIFLRDFVDLDQLDFTGTETPGDVDDNLKSVRLVDATDFNSEVLSIYDSSNPNDEDLKDNATLSLSGTLQGLSSDIIDQLYNGDLAIEIETEVGTEYTVGNRNLQVSPEVDDIAELPTSQTEFVNGTRYYVEIWATDQLSQLLAAQGGIEAGLRSLQVDFHWGGNSVADFDGIVVTGEASVWNSLSSPGNPNGNTGIVTDINGSTFMRGVAANGSYGRLGYLVFTASAETTVDYTLTMTPGAGVTGDAVNRDSPIDISQVTLVGTSVTQTSSGNPLHGTESQSDDVSGTTVDVVVVKEQTQIDSTGHAFDRPESVAWVDEWGTFWAEIYVETSDTNAIANAMLDLNYNTEFFTATEIEFGSAFVETGNVMIDDANGKVSSFIGNANLEGVGSQRSALLARVKFESLEQDGVAINFNDKFIGPHDLGLTLSNVSIGLSGGYSANVTVGDSPETDLWAIAYDVNDDDEINFRDLTIFASIYGDDVLDSNSAFAWAFDTDKSGSVNFKDLTSFASNYGLSKRSGQQIVYPENFLQRWYGQATDLAGNSSIDEVMDTALGIWQSALGLDEPLEIQLVITDLGGTQLGAGQITSVDEQGRPVAGIVTLDDDAAGLGWYSDITTTAFGGGELDGGVSYTADSGSDADGHYDLLTVLLHEIGHVAGFTNSYAPFESHIEVGVGGTLSFVGGGFEATLTDDGVHLDDTVHAGDVMNATLDPGVRKLPSILDALILQTAHETAAAGDFEILVGVNAPLMANVPLLKEQETEQVADMTVIAPQLDLTPVIFDAVSSLDESGQLTGPVLSQILDSLKLTDGGETQLDLTLLEGLNEEFVQSLRLNGLSIVESGEISGSEISELEPEDWSLTGLDQEVDAEFDEVFSDWTGPIL